MINQNLKKYFEENFSDNKFSITEVSKGGDKNLPLISSEKEIYFFDKISDELQNNPGTSKMTSIDGVDFRRNIVDFIEFKSGFTERIAASFNRNMAKCEIKNDICDEYWTKHFDLRDAEKKLLIDILKIKAIETILLLQNLILSHCEVTDTSYKLHYTVVIDDLLEPCDEYIEFVAQEGLDDHNSVVEVLKQSLSRFNNSTIYNRTFYYDEINVLFASEYCKSISNY